MTRPISYLAALLLALPLLLNTPANADILITKQEQMKKAMADEKFDKALAIAKDLKERVKARFGLDDKNYAYLLNNMGEIYRATGKLALAEEYLTQAAAKLLKFLGSDNPKMAIMYKNLGQLSLAQKKYAKAEQHFKRSMTIIDRAPGKNAELTSFVLTQLYIAYGKQNKHAKAGKTMLKAIHLHSSSNQNKLATYNKLGQYLLHNQQYDLAKECFKRIVALSSKEFGADHDLTKEMITILKKLGNL